MQLSCVHRLRSLVPTAQTDRQRQANLCVKLAHETAKYLGVYTEEKSRTRSNSIHPIMARWWITLKAWTHTHKETDFATILCVVLWLLGCQSEAGDNWIKTCGSCNAHYFQSYVVPIASKTTRSKLSYGPLPEDKTLCACMCICMCVCVCGSVCLCVYVCVGEYNYCRLCPFCVFRQSFPQRASVFDVCIHWNMNLLLLAHPLPFRVCVCVCVYACHVCVCLFIFTDKHKSH